jgi:cysteine desulfurase
VLATCEWLEASQGYRVHRIPVDRQGRLDAGAYEAALSDRVALVSIMWANNETGVVFPIDRIAEITSTRGALLHVDGVQAAGKLPIDLEKTRVDLLTLSGHKLHAPKGVGLLFVRRQVPVRPVITGGGQERGRRSGTENLPGIVGFGMAMELAAAEPLATAARIRALRDKLEEGILASIPNTARNGASEPRLANTTNISFEGVEGEAILLLLDEAGVCASSGSACSTGALEPSHVLKAMGLTGAEAVGAVRLSLGRYTTEAEVDSVIEILPGIVRRLREITDARRKTNPKTL